MNTEYDHDSVIMEWDPTDRIYVVTVPELPGCMTHGSTLEEAALQVQDAIEGWIEAAQAWGHPIPRAAYFDIKCDSIIMQNSSEYLEEAEAPILQNSIRESRTA